MLKHHLAPYSEHVLHLWDHASQHIYYRQSIGASILTDAALVTGLDTGYQVSAALNVVRYPIPGPWECFEILRSHCPVMVINIITTQSTPYRNVYRTWLTLPTHPAAHMLKLNSYTIRLILLLGVECEVIQMPDKGIFR